MTTTGGTIAVTLVLGGAVFAITHDVIIGVAVSEACYAVAFRILKSRQHARR